MVGKCVRSFTWRMWRALWSGIICVVVTVVVSLLTNPKTNLQLEGLVYGATQIPSEGHLPLIKRPIFWADSHAGACIDDHPVWACAGERRRRKATEPTCDSLSVRIPDAR